MRRSAFLLLLFFELSVICASPPSNPDSNGLRLNSERPRRLLRQAKEHLDNGRQDVALQLLQQLLDDPQEVFLVDDSKENWQRARQLAETMICDANLLPRYRRAFDAQAENLLAEASDPIDIAALREIGKRFFLTPAGRKAVSRLAAIHFDRGQFQQAKADLERLVGDCSSADSISETHHEQLAVIRSLLGTSGDAVAELSKLAHSQHREAFRPQLEQLVRNPVPTSVAATPSNELLLMRLARDENREIKAAATARLVGMYRQAGFEEDARRLEAGSSNESAASKVHIKPMWRCRVEMTTPKSQSQIRIQYPVRDHFPSFSACWLELQAEADRTEVRLLGISPQRSILWTLPGIKNSKDESFGPGRFRMVGHIAIVSFGHVVAALSGLDGTVLWYRETLETDCPIAAVTSEYLATVEDNQLHVVDLFTGTPQWSHGPLPEEYLVIGTPSELLITDSTQGTTFASHRIDTGMVSGKRHYGVNVLRYTYCQNEKDTVLARLDVTRGGLIVHSLDTVTTKEHWAHVFALGTRYFRGQDNEIILLEPRGKLAVIDTLTGTTLIEDQLALDIANQVSGIRFFTEGAQHFLSFDLSGTLSRKGPDNARVECTLCNGPLRVYDRQTSKLAWERRFDNTWVIRRPGQSFPLLLTFVSREKGIDLQLLDRLDGTDAGSYQFPFPSNELWLRVEERSLNLGDASSAVRIHLESAME